MTTRVGVVVDPGNEVEDHDSGGAHEIGLPPSPARNRENWVTFDNELK